MDKNNEFERFLNELIKLDQSFSKSSIEGDTPNNFFEEINTLMSDIQKDLIGDAFKLNVNFKKLHENAVIPTYAKPHDAGMDLTITDIKYEDVLKIQYGFGFALEIPKGYVGLLLARSSVQDNDLILSNCVGVIDSGYRGEVKATFYKQTHKKYNIGERGAQLIILPYPKINFIEKDELDTSERGENGFGHTGK
jgi:dUTP pyrophosphatase